MVQLTTVTKPFWNNLVPCRYILKLQKDSLATGNSCKKLKHASIIIGCWDIHWSAYQLFYYRHISVYIALRHPDIKTQTLFSYNKYFSQGLPAYEWNNLECKQSQIKERVESLFHQLWLPLIFQTYYLPAYRDIQRIQRKEGQSPRQYQYPGNRSIVGRLFDIADEDWRRYGLPPKRFTTLNEGMMCCRAQ